MLRLHGGRGMVVQSPGAIPFQALLYVSLPLTGSHSQPVPTNHAHEDKSLERVLSLSRKLLNLRVILGILSTCNWGHKGEKF